MRLIHGLHVPTGVNKKTMSRNSSHVCPTNAILQIHTYVCLKDSESPNFESFEALIVARIPPANFVSSLRLMIESLRRGNLLNWSMVLLTLVMLVEQCFPGTFSVYAVALKQWLAQLFKG